MVNTPWCFRDCLQTVASLRQPHVIGETDPGDLLNYSVGWIHNFIMDLFYIFGPKFSKCDVYFISPSQLPSDKPHSREQQTRVTHDCHVGQRTVGHKAKHVA